MDIVSDKFVEKHVIDIQAIYPGGSTCDFVLQTEDSYKELKDRIEVTFKSPWEDLPHNTITFYKATLQAFIVRHRMQRYRVGDTTPATSGSIFPPTYTQETVSE